MNSANQWNLNETEKEQAKTVKKLRVTLSILIALTGGVILSLQVVPLTISYLKTRAIEVRASSLQSPLPGYVRTEIDGEFAYWDPSASYFDNLLREAGKVASTSTQSYNPLTKTYNPIVVDQEYSTPMTLTIKSLDIQQVNLTPNVESYDEKVYDEILKKGLAHFKGTPVCGDGGNCFVYGHSAVQTYFQRHKNDPETIFTRLEDIEIGDEVEVNRDGETLKYKVRKIKIIEPEDFSVLKSGGDKETITLMTCSPVGIGTQRLIVIADRYE